MGLIVRAPVAGMRVGDREPRQHLNLPALYLSALPVSAGNSACLPWTCVLAPSPPEFPDDCIVSLALTSCFTCCMLTDASRLQVDVHTFVTLVPARKNTISRMKGRLQGCTACATAVSVAAMHPQSVRVLCDHARYTIATITGAAMMAFISDVDCNCRCRCVQRARGLHSRYFVPVMEARAVAGVRPTSSRLKHRPSWWRKLQPTTCVEIYNY
jgi:hypothetical protein